MNKEFIPDSRGLAPGSRIVLVEARSLNRRLMVDWLKKGLARLQRRRRGDTRGAR